MIKQSGVFERFIDFENLYDGYLLARKHKRYRDEPLKYSANLDVNLINSQNELIHKTYCVKRMHEFIEYYPKKRIITVMPFENRVVNCAAFNVLMPIYSKSLYRHSYGSIAGRGTLAAALQLQKWMQIVSRKPGKWYLGKMDIRRFYFRMPFDVQMHYMTKPLDDKDMEWFIEQAIKCDGRAFGLPLEDVDVTECERIAGIGMNVGSIMSTMAGNVCMTPADNYIKRDLLAPYYLRNTDDMIFLCEGKERAWEILGKFSEYLENNLGLTLNSKTCIMPYDAGPEFVGRRIWPNKIQLRKSTTIHMKQHIKYIMEHYTTGEFPMEYALSVFRGYLGMLKYCDCDEFKQKFVEDFHLVRHYAEEYKGDGYNGYPDF